jgi:hypothetical protein
MYFRVMTRYCLWVLLIFFVPSVAAQTKKKKKARRTASSKTTDKKLLSNHASILDFGAIANDGKDDTKAFQDASKWINSKKTGASLFFPKGVYQVGSQKYKQAGFHYKDQEIILLKNVTNVKLYGEPGSIIKYNPGLKYGSYDTLDGKPYLKQEKNIYNTGLIAALGSIIRLDSVDRIEIRDLELDGNIEKQIIGGKYGDVGCQIPHNGIFLSNVFNGLFINLKVYNFGLDGLMYGAVSQSKYDTAFVAKNCVFTLNGRNAMSIIGGRGFYIYNSKFTKSGHGKVASMPMAGCDIESEWSPIANGLFQNCNFEQNSGVGFLADSGPSENFSLDNCFFWGDRIWSVWVTKKNYTIKNSTIVGSIVHGYADAKNEQEATKYLNCYFVDSTIGDKKAYGNFLIELNGAKRMQFKNCKFRAKEKKLMWVDGSGSVKREDKYYFEGNTFFATLDGLVTNDYFSVFRTVVYKNNMFYINKTKANMNGLWLQSAASDNIGGNYFIYKDKVKEEIK